MHQLYGKTIEFKQEWLDNQKHLTKLVPWAIENLPEGTIYSTSLPGEFDTRFANHVVQIQRRTPSPLESAVQIDYMYNDNGEHMVVKLTERELGVYRLPGLNRPWRVYRPVLDADGNISYALVRETIVHHYAPEGCPAFVNYLLQRALGTMWRFLENDVRFDFDKDGFLMEDFIAEHFQEHLFADRTLTDYNDVRSTEPYVQWFQDLQAFARDTDPAQSSLETLAGLLNDFGQRFNEIAKDLPDRFPEGSFENADDDDGFAVSITEAVTA